MKQRQGREGLHIIVEEAKTRQRRTPHNSSPMLSDTIRLYVTTNKINKNDNLIDYSE